MLLPAEQKNAYRAILVAKNIARGAVPGEQAGLQIDEILQVAFKFVKKNFREEIKGAFRCNSTAFEERVSISVGGQVIATKAPQKRRNSLVQKTDRSRCGREEFDFL